MNATNNTSRLTTNEKYDMFVGTAMMKFLND